MGPILVKKSLQEGPISQKLQKKIVKSGVFKVPGRKIHVPLEIDSNLQKFLKNSQISCFCGRKILKYE